MDSPDEIISSISLNKILVAILDIQGSITVPTMDFLKAEYDNKELVVDYDEEGPSFIFSVREKNELE